MVGVAQTYKGSYIPFAQKKRIPALHKPAQEEQLQRHRIVATTILSFNPRTSRPGRFLDRFYVQSAFQRSSQHTADEVSSQLQEELERVALITDCCGQGVAARISVTYLIPIFANVEESVRSVR
jgi:hypothetical protein